MPSSTIIFACGCYIIKESANVHILTSSDCHPLSSLCPLRFQGYRADEEALLIHVGTAASSPASNQQQQQLERLRLCLAQCFGKLIFIWPQCWATGPRKGIIGYYSFVDKSYGFMAFCWMDMVNSWCFPEDAPLNELMMVWLHPLNLKSGRVE